VAQPGDASRPAVGGSDWTAQAADTIERVVVTVRDKTAVPLTTVARALVYGLLAATMGLVVAVFGAIIAIRVLTVYLFRGDVWASYLLVGAIFVAPGLFFLRKASSATTKKGSRT
jgi:hypothetical protein